MDKLFILNPAANFLDIKDGISDRLTKISAIITCLMFSVEFIKDEFKIDGSVIYNTLLAVDYFLRELDYLYNKMNDITN